MIWNEDKGYLRYKMSLDGVFNKLGLRKADYEVRPELAPYLTRIFEYLNEKLTELDSNDIKERLNLVFGIFDRGSDMIVAGQSFDLAEEVGVTSVTTLHLGDKVEYTEDIFEDEILDGYVLDPDEIDYNADRFVFCWTNVMSCLITRLKLMYAGILETPPTRGCGCCKWGKGETQKDWDNFSDVNRYGKYNDTDSAFPEDEEYRIASTNSSTGVPNASSIPDCVCTGRKASNV